MNIVESNLNKLIAIVLIPAITALASTAAGALTIGVEDWTGADLDDGQVTAAVVGIAVTVGLATASGLITYLRNLDFWQRNLAFGSTDTNANFEPADVAVDENPPPDVGGATKP